MDDLKRIGIPATRRPVQGEVAINHARTYTRDRASGSQDAGAGIAPASQDSAPGISGASPNAAPDGEASSRRAVALNSS